MGRGPIFAAEEGWPMTGQLIGLKDRDGREIRVGDIVEFYFCGDHGTKTSGDPCEPFEDCRPTRCVDEVIDVDGMFYFQSPGFGGAMASRHNDKCRVIGSLPDDCEMYWRENKRVV